MCAIQNLKTVNNVSLQKIYKEFPKASALAPNYKPQKTYQKKIDLSINGNGLFRRTN
jgi:hypothetical protein